MPAVRSRRRARLAALTSVALAVTGFQFFLAPQAAQAASTTVLVNEVYVNGGSAGALYTNKYVELRNLTGSAIDLTGMSIQYRAPGTSGAAGNMTALTGSIPANGYYVVVGGSNGAVGSPVPTTPGAFQNATGTFNPGGAGGTVALVNGGTAVDLAVLANSVDKLGYGTSNAPEGNASGAGPTGNSVTKSIGRKNATDTDVNTTDFEAQDPTPNASNTGGATTVSLANPGPQTSTVGSAITPLQLVATGGSGTRTFGATNLPSGLILDTATGIISGTPDTAGAPNVTVSVSDTSGNDSKQFTWTVNPAPVGVTPIADIQGTGAASAMDGQVKTTEGVVTATFPSGGLNGFYIQTPGPDTAGASDAIFVFDNGAFDAYPAVGDQVRVTGEVDEFGTAPNTLTEIVITANSNVVPATLSGTVTPKTVVPGTTCAVGACPTAAADTNTLREPVEGELFQPTGSYTVTDAYDGSAYTGTSGSSSNFGEIGLAAESTLPLISQTEVETPGPAASSPRIAYNNAHRIILDDGASTTFWNTNNPPDAPGRFQDLPWLTPTHQVRVGAAVTFPAPVVLDWRNGVWKFQPRTQVVGAPTPGEDPQFVQDRPAAPANVGGDLKLATFNVLNYFTTLGADYDAGPGTCSAFLDKNGNPVAVNSCSGNGPRGAWDAANFARQQEKIVAAINTMDADIVSLEEIENSRKVDGANRDEAIGALVTALNTAAGGTRWAFVPSPATLPTVDDEDVIRTGFIYDPSTVDVIGDAQVLVGSAPFANAREPFAAAFKKEGAPADQGFAVVVNHFKSKGSGGATGDNVDAGDGAGAYNGDRTRQAQALDTFAKAFAAARGVQPIFLTGDFNSYSKEQPVTTLNAAGWTKLESTDDPQEESYSFDGASGSLDHVFANAAAAALVSGVDIWEINANESVFNQYSRYDYVTPRLYQPGPFSASDHNPEIIGINAPAEPATRDIQILGTNDFHGRIANDPTTASAGAAVMAGAVKQLRGANPNTVFAAAGDLIGATTFESFIDKDKPTIDALNSAGLEVSSVGNHEFDQGVDDLVNRVIAPYDATTNPKGGANWKYLAANIRKKSDNQHLLAPSWTKDFGSVRVGFIGAVTEHLPELVSPAGIASINVTNVVTEVNAAANDLEAGGADVIVLLVHEGASRTDCTGDILDPTSDFGEIVAGVNEKVDAIVSGHTHLEYNCSFPVPAWASDVNHPVKERPVVSSGQYGFALNQLVFKVDTATGRVLTKSQAVLKLKAGTSGSNFNYPVDGPTQSIVTAAVNAAAVEGAKPAGKISGPLYRGKLADGTTENRGQESTLGNLVAEVQQDSTEDPALGGAQIAFMNPGGLRQDLLGTGTTSPRDVTFRQIADVQPFGNTLVNLKLTGAQIKTVLEQQWQPTGAARPFLRLGVSKGFTYTYDPAAAAGQRIKEMRLNGVVIDPVTKYSVTVNAFLASGGDNFFEFANGTEKKDAGQVDLQAFLNYMTENFATTPLAVDYSQRAVGVSFPAGAPAAYDAGEHVKFNVSSWSMTGPGDVKDTEVVVKLGGTTLGTAPLDHTPVATTDEAGKASVDVVLPDTLGLGTHTLTLSGAATGTEVPVTITVGRAKPAVSATAAAVRYGKATSVTVKVSGPGGVVPTGGTVTLRVNGVPLASGAVSNGQATITLPARSLTPGTTGLTADYSGSSNLTAGTGSFNVVVSKAEATVEGKVKPGSPSKKQNVKLTVKVEGSDGVDATGEVKVVVGGEDFYGVLENGKLKLNLGKFGNGKHKVKIVYSGSNLVEGGKEKVTFTVS